MRAPSPFARFSIAAVLVLLAPLLSSRAHAQEGMRIDRFMPPTTSADGLAIPTAETVGHLEPAFGLVLDYAFQPLVGRTNDGQFGAIVSHRVVANLLAAIGVLDLLEFHLRLPVVFQAGDAPILAGNTFDAPDPATVSDPAIGGSVRIFGEDPEGFHLGALVEAFIPLAGANGYASDQEFSMRGLLLADVVLSGAAINFAAGASYRPERNVSTFRSASEFHFAAGGRFLVSPGAHMLAELIFSTGLREDLAFQSGGSALELILGGRYVLDNGLGIEVGIGIGFLTAPGTPSFRGFAGVRWDPTGPPPADADGDTLLDAVDPCPAEAEDVDRFEDTDGCPEPDNDEDGVLDGADECGREVEDVDGFNDTDGCPDPDDDEDGIVDEEDSCRRAPGTRAHDGCPATLNLGEDGTIELVRNVDFAAGEAALVASNGPLLDELSAVMMLDTAGHRWRIVVRPARAGRDDGTRLAQARAESLIRSLVARGVDAERLEPAVGNARDDLYVAIITLEGGGAAPPESDAESDGEGNEE